MLPPDVVYPLKSKSQYEELRYSLRSLKNVPHGRVFIAGEKLPDWAKDVTFIHVPRVKGETRFQNAERNWAAACSSPHLSDDFIAMNDDFFIMKPVEEIKPYHEGDLAECIKVRQKYGVSENYEVAMIKALDTLRERGIETPLGYILHFPMMMNKHKRQALHYQYKEEIDQGQIMLMRTYYGNIYQVGGEKSIDCKYINNNFDPNMTFLSSNDAAFKYEKYGEFIRSNFPKKSAYEN